MCATDMSAQSSAVDARSRDQTRSLPCKAQDRAQRSLAPSKCIALRHGCPPGRRFPTNMVFHSMILVQPDRVRHQAHGAMTRLAATRPAASPSRETQRLQIARKYEQKFFVPCTGGVYRFGKTPPRPLGAIMVPDKPLRQRRLSFLRNRRRSNSAWSR